MAMTSPPRRVRVASENEYGNSLFTTLHQINLGKKRRVNKMSKRTLDAFFKPAAQPSTPKKLKSSPDPSSPLPSKAKYATETIKDASENELPPESHPTYPFSIAKLPSHVSVGLSFATPAKQPRVINDQPHLNLLYYEPYIPQPTAKEYFHFLRRELPFYRVRYTIKRGPTETVINTPRYTTVFGVDTTSYFSGIKGEGIDKNNILLDSKTNQSIKPDKYKCTPRPIPDCLDLLRRRVEEAIADGTTYNFVLVNYYSSGDDSISYHSDDERFLGANPNIASLTLGAKRDFLMKHKPPPSVAKGTSLSGGDKPLKIPLATGDMIVMRGETQANWLHSIPKRKGGETGQGRINITLRKAIVPGGTENYYRYNVGDGGLYRWDDKGKEMVCQSV
jgi:alkylated DNA repair dioxygenase AlkB